MLNRRVRMGVRALLSRLPRVVPESTNRAAVAIRVDVESWCRVAPDGPALDGNARNLHAAE